MAARIQAALPTCTAIPSLWRRWLLKVSRSSLGILRDSLCTRCNTAGPIPPKVSKASGMNSCEAPILLYFRSLRSSAKHAAVGPSPEAIVW